MTGLAAHSIEIARAATRYFEGGIPEKPAVLFLHGGVPGVTPYCGGAHIWGDSLALFATERRVVALDLPGSSGSALGAGETPTLDVLMRRVLGLIDALELRLCHVVGHDLGGLIALALAADAPQRIASVSVVASAFAAPSGDGMQNLTHAYPPEPRFSRLSQLWAIERVSYSRLHIDDALLDACVAASTGAAHRQATEVLAGDNFRRVFLPSVTRRKNQLWELYREAGLSVPVQLLWAMHDPLTSVEQGMALYRLIAARQRAAHFHLVNRAGSLLFREQPEEFHAIVAAFQDGFA